MSGAWPVALGQLFVQGHRLRLHLGFPCSDPRGVARGPGFLREGGSSSALALPLPVAWKVKELSGKTEVPWGEVLEEPFSLF